MLTLIRLFYLQATENDQLSTNFDKMAMYGVEFRARLLVMVCLLILVLGGGYLNPSSNYLGVNDVSADGEEFASAGLGCKHSIE
jgi:hypothetical protein